MPVVYTSASLSAFLLMAGLLASLPGACKFSQSEEAALNDSSDTVDVVLAPSFEPTMDGHVIDEPRRMTNLEIQTAILAALRRHVIAEGDEISVTVFREMAVLTGRVDKLGKKVEAGAIAARIPGVKRVDNQLKTRNATVGK